jgi:serine/threonine protein kinase/formylglycine-generating enzyme required for sulfatase activity
MMLCDLFSSILKEGTTSYLFLGVYRMKWRELWKKRLLESKNNKIYSSLESSQTNDSLPDLSNYGPSSGGDTIAHHSSFVLQSPSPKKETHTSIEKTEKRSFTDQLEEEGFFFLSLLGKGGMGSVYSVEDMTLQAPIALKVIHRELLSSKHYKHRFIEEARVAAFLTHPNIPPVHQMGLLSDGRPFFTMREIQGFSLKDAIEYIYKDRKNKEKHEFFSTGEWDQHRLIEVFHKVCETMAYAHSKEVIHRDLKPANIMLGQFGEVWVVDWGLVKRLGAEEVSLESPKIQSSTPNLGYQTQYGTIEGTPPYMSPEQARGETNALNTRSDVYALGSILYECLCGNKAYKKKKDNDTILHAVQNGEYPSLIRTKETLSVIGSSWNHPPAKLVDICEQAMERLPEDRFIHAGEFAHSIQDWLDGKHKEQKAQELLEEARISKDKAKELRGKAEFLLQKTKQMRAIIPLTASISEKLEMWNKEDRALVLQKDAKKIEGTQEHLLMMALQFAPTYLQAHKQLIMLYQQEHQNAEWRGEQLEVSLYEEKIRWHLSYFPKEDPLHTKIHTYLQGGGFLSLHTEQVSNVWISRYTPCQRRLVLEEEEFLGKTPLHKKEIPMGSYRLRISTDGCHDVIYPICIDRLQHWDCHLPKEQHPSRIHALQHHELKETECYVPGGWCWIGGDHQGANGMREMRTWIKSFVIQKYQVTVGEYIFFLNDLVDQGNTDLAERYEPRERAGGGASKGKEALGASLLGKNKKGHYFLQPDTDGDMWELDWPIMMVDYQSTLGYAKWLSKKTGQKWRLPFELEWEKAAKGTDRRRYPWGNYFDHTWAHVQGSLVKPYPSSIYNFPIDESPYGVRGMSGGFIDWTASEFSEEGPICRGDIYQEKYNHDIEVARAVRGGAWTKSMDSARIGARTRWPELARFWYLSFRLLREIK